VRSERPGIGPGLTGSALSLSLPTAPGHLSPAIPGQNPADCRLWLPFAAAAGCSDCPPASAAPRRPIRSCASSHHLNGAASSAACGCLPSEPSDAGLLSASVLNARAGAAEAALPAAAPAPPANSAVPRAAPAPADGAAELALVTAPASALSSSVGSRAAIMTRATTSSAVVLALISNDLAEPSPAQGTIRAAAAQVESVAPSQEHLPVYQHTHHTRWPHSQSLKSTTGVPCPLTSFK
jgi:hypothetical protein